MAHTLVSRGEVRYRFETPENYVGYEVRDPEGRKIGRVKGLFTNAHSEPEYVQIGIGSLGLRTILMPVRFVAADEKRRTLILE